MPVFYFACANQCWSQFLFWGLQTAVTSGSCSPSFQSSPPPAPVWNRLIQAPGQSTHVLTSHGLLVGWRRCSDSSHIRGATGPQSVWLPGSPVHNGSCSDLTSHNREQDPCVCVCVCVCVCECTCARVCACINFLMPDISDATADQGISMSFLRILCPIRIHSLWKRHKCGMIEPDVTRLAAVHSRYCLLRQVQWL